MYVYKDDKGYKLSTEVVTKHYKEPNVGVVGSPTISSDCIASGFSTSNYLTIPIDYVSTNGYTYVWCFTPTAFSDLQRIAHREYFLTLEIDSSGVVAMYSWSGKGSVTICTASLNKKYWVKQYINGTTKTAYYSTDGVNYTLGGSIADTSMQPTSTTYNGGKIVMGTSSYDSSKPATSYIDLNECYIMDNNNNVVWRGINEYDKERNNYFALDYTNLSVNNLVVRTIKDNTESGETDNSNTDSTDNNSGDNSTDNNSGGTDNTGTDNTGTDNSAYSVLDPYRDGEQHTVYDSIVSYRYFIYEESRSTPWVVTGYLDYTYYYEDEDFLPIYQDWINSGYTIDETGGIGDITVEVNPIGEI